MVKINQPLNKDKCQIKSRPSTQ